MKFSRTRKIENNVFETKIAFKAYGGDAIYDEKEEKRLVNDFGFPSIEIGYIKGKYEVKEELGKKKVVVTPDEATVEKYQFDSDPLAPTFLAEPAEAVAAALETEITVCAHARGLKALDENFSVVFRLPVKDASGVPVAPAELTSEELSEYEAKCRLFEETIIARAILAIKDLYAKDTLFEIEEDADEIIIAKNTVKPVPENVHDGEDIFIG